MSESVVGEMFRPRSGPAKKTRTDIVIDPGCPFFIRLIMQAQDFSALLRPAVSGQVF